MGITERSSVKKLLDIYTQSSGRGSAIRMQWTKWLFLTTIGPTRKYLANGCGHGHVARLKFHTMN